MKPRRQGRKERTEPNHRGRASVPTYTAMDAERSPASPKGQHRYLLERTYRSQPKFRKGKEPKERAGLSNDGEG